MDLFKNVKDLKVYSKELSALFEGITRNGAKIKIGKFKIIDTPSDDAAIRLYDKLRVAVESELIVVSTTYGRIEKALKEMQTELFKEPVKEVEGEVVQLVVEKAVKQEEAPVEVQEGN